MSLTLEQAKEISRLSTILTDECTWAPEFGVGKYCVMHDHLLIHFVWKTRILNRKQISYMAAQNILDATCTYKQANHLFREGLQEKIQTEDSYTKKLFYWGIRNTYYVAVVGWHRIRRWLS